MQNSARKIWRQCRHQAGLVWWRIQANGLRFRQKMEEWRQARELMSMNDAMLKDIGVARGGIDWSVHNGRDRDVSLCPPALPFVVVSTPTISGELGPSVGSEKLQRQPLEPV